MIKTSLFFLKKNNALSMHFLKKKLQLKSSKKYFIDKLCDTYMTFCSGLSVIQ